MPTARRSLSRLLLLLALPACARGPSRVEVTSALRLAQPGIDGGAAYGHVWQDGPPWFSCAEVLAKVASPVDSAAVRDQVGNWKPLVLAGWVTLRDSAKGPVADPGWCTLRITAAGQSHVATWTPEPGPVFATGDPRRGWRVLVGQRRLAVTGTRMAGTDSAAANYMVIVATNPEGVAVGAGRDTARFIATLRRADGRWEVVGTRAATSSAR